jgi:hypothetical protein
MLLICDQNLKHLTDEEILLLCVKEYADPENYESYEKDYGRGRKLDRLPYIAKHKHQYAQDILTYLAARKESRSHGEMVDTADLKSSSASCSGSSPDESTTNKGVK